MSIPARVGLLSAKVGFIVFGGISRAHQQHLMLAADNGSVQLDEDGGVFSDGPKHDVKDSRPTPYWKTLPDLLLIFVPSCILLLSARNNGT